MGRCLRSWWIPSRWGNRLNPRPSSPARRGRSAVHGCGVHNKEVSQHSSPAAGRKTVRPVRSNTSTIPGCGNTQNPDSGPGGIRLTDERCGAAAATSATRTMASASGRVRSTPHRPAARSRLIAAGRHAAALANRGSGAAMSQTPWQAAPPGTPRALEHREPRRAAGNGSPRRRPCARAPPGEEERWPGPQACGRVPSAGRV